MTTIETRANLTPAQTARLAELRDEWRDMSIEALYRAQSNLVGREHAAGMMRRAGFVSGAQSDLLTYVEIVIAEREESARRLVEGL